MQGNAILSLDDGRPGFNRAAVSRKEQVESIRVRYTIAHVPIRPARLVRNDTEDRMRKHRWLCLRVRSESNRLSIEGAR